MLKALSKLVGHEIVAEDGKCGKADDFYFDDLDWTVRYVVVDTGHWLPGKLVLVSPVAAGEPDDEAKALPIRLTCAKVKNGPTIERDMPVSRQHEAELAKYYSWPAYWLPAVGGEPVAPITSPPPETAPPPANEEQGDPHLRSLREVAGYHVVAKDGEIGHIEDMIVETEGWRVRYLAVDTRNWLPGRKVLVSPQWLSRIDWSGRIARVDLTREQIRHSPEYDPDQPISRQYAIALENHYARESDEQ